MVFRRNSSHLGLKLQILVLVHAWCGNSFLVKSTLSIRVIVCCKLFIYQAFCWGLSTNLTNEFLIMKPTVFRISAISIRLLPLLIVDLNSILFGPIYGDCLISKINCSWRVVDNFNLWEIWWLFCKRIVLNPLIHNASLGWLISKNINLLCDSRNLLLILICILVCNC